MTRRAVALALALFEETFPTFQPTERTADAWSLMLKELSDEEIGSAAIQVAKHHRHGPPSASHVWDAARGPTHKITHYATDPWGRRIVDSAGSLRVESVSKVRFQPGETVPPEAERIAPWATEPGQKVPALPGPKQQELLP